MKRYSTLLTLLFIAASTNAQAITINLDGTVDGIIPSDLMLSSSGTFFDWSSPDTSASSRRDPAASITNDALTTTFAYSNTAGAFVELGFSTSIYNGVGDDLAFFTVGNPATMDFSAVVSDGFGNTLSITSTTNPYNVEWVGDLNVGGTAIALNMILIDLDDYGSDVFGINPLTSIQFNFGSEFGSPGLSLAGGIHPAATVIPLPLPVILFGSGLGLLGFFGRRKKA